MATTGLVLAAGITLVAVGLQPPSRSRIERNLFGPQSERNLLAYQVVDDRPYAVYIDERRAKVILTELKQDPFDTPNMWWQLSGTFYGLMITESPASLGVASCDRFYRDSCTEQTLVYGQINAPGIVDLELLIADEWLRYPVSPPGFLVALSSADEAPSDYRWLDRAERVVWSAEDS